jgi:predicted DNA-binding protein
MAHPTSVRLSPLTQQRLAEASQRTRRSQSELIEETLSRHLESVVYSRLATSKDDARAALRKLMGAGSRACGPRSVEDIDASIREMRRDRN